jgi:Divergent InlB B-repeat domain
MSSSRRRGLFIAGLLAMLALFPATASAALTVAVVDKDRLVDGSSWGQVTSSPAGIDCPGDCEEPFAPDTEVTLTATATYGYSLAGWTAGVGDPGCAQAMTCTVTVAADTSIDAEFHPAAQLTTRPRGAGMVEISPTQPGRGALCDVDFEQEAGEPSCVHRYVTGTRVRLTARPDAGATFKGWTDYACRNSSSSCTLTMRGERFIAALFDPVRLQVSSGAFGGVTVSRPRGFCALLETSPLCEFTYRSGTLVRLRREHAAPGQYWVGACAGNVAGLLDADVCTLRLDGDTLVAAGADNVTAIPPPLGSGIQVRLGGNKRGKVTGGVVNKPQRVNCGSRCLISGGVTGYDRVTLTATHFRRSRFVGWSNGMRLRKISVRLAKVNAIRATFGPSRRR